ncbi:helix-turn-helix transcriptional regulator [candidate division KSB1 bacterium]|nr:helix-turn-helix transcriptional regulator [candidate division KSB1 bacterium]
MPDLIRTDIRDKIHWTTGEEMLFSAQYKYLLDLPAEFPFCIKFYKFTPAFPIVPNYHDFYEIGCFFSGDAIYHIADYSFKVQAGSIVFIQSDQMHTVEADPDNLLLSASIYFRPELICHAGNNPVENSYLLPFLSSNSTKSLILQQNDLGISIWQFVLDMYQEYCDNDDFYQLALKNRLSDLLLVALRMMKRLNLLQKAQTPQNKIKRLDTVLGYIQHHYAESVTLEQLSEIAFMNASYFCRYFKQVIGLSPINYILRYRIDKAKELLLNSSLSITEVAFKVGFNSQSYFDRLFQKFTRMNPKNFRQKHANNIYNTIK